MRNERETPDQKVADWRTGKATDSPAGPLFTSGTYAQSEITRQGRVGTGHCSACSASGHSQCC